jgi:hypothetical protein
MSTKTCKTPGCFKTAYGTDYCGKCLGGDTPEKRGPVKLNEAWRAHLTGGIDEAITRSRLVKNGQPTDILDRALPEEVYEEAERLSKKKSTTIAQTDFPQKIFLSYAKEDVNKVEPLYNELYKRGHVPWMDKKNLLPGQYWEAEIGKAISESDYFIFCLSEKSTNKRGYVQKEMKLGLEELDKMPDNSIYFIPIRLEQCLIPQNLKKLHVVDMEEDGSLEKLIIAIELKGKKTNQ